MSLAYTKSVMESVAATHADQPEFLQAVREVYGTLAPAVAANPRHEQRAILQRLVEPERIVCFRIVWQRDDGTVEVNRGYRVQFNSAIGPYKGGLRFHPSVNLSVLKFLGFEQIFKNALTGLPMGAGKGGADFDPKGKSDDEVMRFCQAFMTELQRHIGADTDVPAGDIGVGGREIGYLYGQYKKIRNTVDGVLTGKSLQWGGSALRPEATGYGTVMFLKAMLAGKGERLEGKKCVVSGSGNVAQFATELLLREGAVVVAMSDSGGVIHDPKGIGTQKLQWISELKNERRGRVSEYTNEYTHATYMLVARGAATNPIWDIPGTQLALPCATQNELSEEDAKNLVKHGAMAVAEGANMPCSPAAVDVLTENGVLFGPGKAANAGGVAVSGMEMSQNSMRFRWSRDEVEVKLQDVMLGIYNASVEAAEQYGSPGDLVLGANVAGYMRVAESMLAQGLV